MIDHHIDYLANHPQYVEEVARLKYEHWLYSAPDRPYHVWVSEIEDTARIGEFPLTLVALDDTGLLGFVSMVVFEEWEGIRDGVWMITLYAKKEHRNRGLGTSLMNRCLSEARQMGVNTVYLWTDEKSLTEYYAQRDWKFLHTTPANEDIMSIDVSTRKDPRLTT